MKLARNATLAIAAVGIVAAGASAGESADVLVATRSDLHTLADTSFHLAVFC